MARQTGLAASAGDGAGEALQSFLVFSQGVATGDVYLPEQRASVGFLGSNEGEELQQRRPDALSAVESLPGRRPDPINQGVSPLLVGGDEALLVTGEMTVGVLEREADSRRDQLDGRTAVTGLAAQLQHGGKEGGTLLAPGSPEAPVWSGVRLGN